MARGLGIGDFARAFNSTYDTFNKVAQDFEVAKIVNDKPVDSTGLSTDQGEQVFQDLASTDSTARDVRKEDGSTGVAVTKSMPEGVEGPAQTKTYEPQKITRYLGQDFVGGLDPAQATRARNRALAGVITKSNPLHGIQLDAALTQTERQDQEYGEKQQVRTLQQQFTAEKDPFKRVEIGRKLTALPGGSEVVKGFGDIEKANLNAVVNHARRFLAKGDVKGAMGVYNAYDNGEDGEVVELPGGGYQLNFYQGKPGEGNLSGSKTFKTADELTTWFNDQFDPDAAVKRRAELAAKQTELQTWQAKEDYQQKGRFAIEDRKAGRLRPGNVWEIDPETGEPTGAQFRTGAGGGSAGGSKKKVPATPEGMASEAFFASIKESSSQNNTFTPEQINMGDAASRSAIKLNPGIDPTVAATAGMLFSTAKPGGTLFAWDPATGAAVEQVQTPQGLVAVNEVTHRNAAARQMPPEKLKVAVESSIQRIAGDNPEQRKMVIDAAFDNTGKARRALLNQARQELASMPEFKKLSPEAQARALQQHESRVDAELAKSLGWIRNFGQDLKPATATQKQQKATNARNPFF